MLSLLAIALVGVVLGMLGGGGSVLILPILVYLVGMQPLTATSYSLLIVGVAASVGAAGYVRQGFVDRMAVLGFGIPSIVGVLITRSFILPRLPDRIMNIGEFAITRNLLVMLIFAIMVIASAVSMIRGPINASSEDDASSDASRRPEWWANILAGLMVGLLTGFVGAGGGFLIVPALVFLVGLPIREAIGTSLFIISIKSLIGFAGDLFVVQSIEWGLMTQFTIAAVVGIVIGIQLNKRIPAERLKPAFGWTILVVGLAILLKELSA
ncbi:MAG: sulfite exporter TauE/SafE family protein [Planctomycetota bacterium]